MPESMMAGEARPGALGPAVEARLEELDGSGVAGRVWARDHTLWADDPAEIADRLGWLDLPETMAGRVAALRHFAAEARTDGFETVVLLGMGGSSLAPEVMDATLRAPEAPRLVVLDTTDPASILALERGADLRRTLFIAASKSGTTVETLSHLEYFWEKVGEGRQFVAITDPGTPLEAIGIGRGFRRVFLATPDLGGRYSALSAFGLVPAALAGVDLDALLRRAREMQAACRPGAPARENPGAWLGVLLGEAALAGRDKLTLLVPDEMATLGTWIEQLIAESTGKRGRGIVPVEGEPLGPPEAYGSDRLFVAIGEHAGLDALAAAGHPVVRLPFTDPGQLPAEFFRWEFATAVAGHVLGITPFDQPNVQEAKDATARILAGAAAGDETAPVSDVLRTVSPGDYIAILAYVPRTPGNDARLQAARLRLRDRYRVATTVGFGPRFLHSTGQLHKGGPDSGVFIQVAGDDPEDVAIPGAPYTFGQLKQAQAQGDLESLRAHGRRVARATWDEIATLGT